jgi:4-amino-4-deoxy-L-arabinose transferase-like glycosyltransferase
MNVKTLWRRFEGRPWWSLVGLGLVTILTAVLYTWALSRNGMGNAYYAAAVKSGSVSWKAFFFGALDPGSFITVDKLPASFWMQALSARIFGFSSWGILLPQALAGIGSVLILYRLVRRWQGEAAALLASLAFALTPIALVIFRFNNPDAMLTFLLLGAAWCVWSALEKGSTWKLVGAGALVGFAFLTKMLEAFVVLPAFVLVYLVLGPRSLGKRLLQTLAAGVALVAAAGWWVAIVELWPAASRPYIGGSSNNSVLDLVFSRSGGYFGNAGGPNFSGSPGWLRVFNAQLGGQISWLVPLAVLGLAGGLWLTRRGGRRDLRRAGYALWGLWMLLCLGVFSFAHGVLHPYYTVLAAPGIAALVGGGSVALWRLGRERWWLAWLLPAGVLVTAVWSAELLWRTSGYAPGLGFAVIAGGVTAAFALGLTLAVVGRATFAGERPSRLASVSARSLRYAAVAVGLFAVLAGPLAYDLSSVSRSVTGSFAAAGPEEVANNNGGPGGLLASVGPGGPGSASTDGQGAYGQPPSAPAGSGEVPSGFNRGEYGPANVSGGAPGAVAGGGGPGGESKLDEALVTFLEENRGTAKYLVAVQGAGSAESIIIASGEPVMAMGGFSNSDPAPTLEQFEQMVAAGEIHYVLVSGGIGGGGQGPGGPGNGTVSSIIQWVKQNGHEVSSSEYSGTASGTLYQVGD